jgi:hypothetical protein
MKTKKKSLFFDFNRRLVTSRDVDLEYIHT